MQAGAAARDVTEQYVGHGDGLKGVVSFTRPEQLFQLLKQHFKGSKLIFGKVEQLVCRLLSEIVRYSPP